MTRSTLAGVVLLLGVASTAAAQDSVEPRVSGEVVASATMLSSYDHVSAVLDVTGTLRLGGGALLIARPWAWHRQDGTSTFQWYQLQLRYQTRTRTPVRIDAGVVTSPVGLNPLQMRADLNPTISPVSYYVIPLPRFEPTFDGLQPLSTGYPFGVIVSTSGTRWDLRGGVIDSTPARPGVELKHDVYPALAQAVAGGGVTLRPGLRVGAALAHGRYRKADAPFGEGVATVVNLETEYTVNHTRVSGEWVADRFDGDGAPVVAKSYYLQGVQTLTPRLFAAARVVHVATPVVFGLGRDAAWTTREVTGGFRVTPQFTVRAGYFGQHSYFSPWSHAAAVSIVWAARWWR
jgi:hypothetical protein